MVLAQSAEGVRRGNIFIVMKVVPRGFDVECERRGVRMTP